MCGIAGFVDRRRRLDGESGVEVLDRMCRVIRHRGPNDQDTMLRGGVGLGMRRLSIIDLAGGHQPISNEDGTVSVVFNGEIYNYRDLQPELEARGHRFRTHSDTETIVHAYEEWGAACVERFRGMFAFAIWDARRKRLLLVRDRLGIKPLYWTVVGDRLLFGSEIKAILASGLVPATPNERAIPELLSTRYLSGTETLFK